MLAVGLTASGAVDSGAWIPCSHTPQEARRGSVIDDDDNKATPEGKIIRGDTCSAVARALFLESCASSASVMATPAAVPSVPYRLWWGLSTPLCTWWLPLPFRFLSDCHLRRTHPAADGLKPTVSIRYCTVINAAHSIGLVVHIHRQGRRCRVRERLRGVAAARKPRSAEKSRYFPPTAAWHRCHWFWRRISLLDWRKTGDKAILTAIQSSLADTLGLRSPLAVVIGTAARTLLAGIGATGGRRHTNSHRFRHKCRHHRCCYRHRLIRFFGLALESECRSAQASTPWNVLHLHCGGLSVGQLIHYRCRRRCRCYCHYHFPCCWKNRRSTRLPWVLISTPNSLL